MRQVADWVLVGGTCLALAAIACGGSTAVTEIAAPDTTRCDTRVSSQTSTIPAAGARISVAITTGRDCTWTAASDAGWLTVSPASGQGSGTVTVVADQNASHTERSGRVIINGSSTPVGAGARVTLMQNAAPPPVAAAPPPASPPSPSPVPPPTPSPGPPQGPSGPSPAPNPPAPACSFDVGPQQQSFGSEGGDGQVRVRTPSDCEWNVSADASWIEIDGARQRRGDGDVRYRVQRNGATQGRSGSISAGGKTHRVDQAAAAPPPPPACSFDLSPDRRSFNADGGEHHVNVHTASGCEWTASSSVSWITIASRNGSGQRHLDYRVLPNTSSQDRSGSISVGGRTHEVEQRGRR
jgi:Viral BACON domain/Putative binding domain, N-terminal